MAVSQRLKSYLDGAKVLYTVTTHPQAFTAQEIAAAQHVTGHRLAKCVLIRTDRGPHLAVLPATRLVDLKRLKAVLKAKSVSLANEGEIRSQFPDIEIGAMSVFGNLYNVPVVVERTLAEADSIVCNAGSHIDTVALRARDAVSLTGAKVAVFAQPIGKSASSKTRRAAKKAAKPKKRPAVKKSRTARKARGK